MFCSKCGKELNQGVQFCPHCGASNGSKTNTATSELFSDVKVKINTGLSSLGNKKLLYVLNLILYVLVLVFYMMPFGATSYTYFSIFDTYFSIFDFNLSCVLLILLPFVIGAFVMVLPLLIDKRLRSGYFLIAEIAEIIACLVTFDMIHITIKLAFGGVCILIFLPIATITTFLLAYKSRSSV